jgi:hypothetical protein
MFAMPVSRQVRRRAELAAQSPFGHSHVALLLATSLALCDCSPHFAQKVGKAAADDIDATKLGFDVLPELRKIDVLPEKRNGLRYLPGSRAAARAGTNLVTLPDGRRLRGTCGVSQNFCPIPFLNDRIVHAHVSLVHASVLVVDTYARYT